MGGFFGTISNSSCIKDLYYGIDYNSHLGTRRGGMATLYNGKFYRAIHNLENAYFRSKFEPELLSFLGNSGIGVISDTDPQPIVINSRLGKFAIVTVACVNNIKELEKDLLDSGRHFSELSSGQTNQTELIALIITQGKTFVEGIELVFQKVKGSCSMLILTEEGIIVARDKFGRTPIVIGKKDGAYAASSEPCAFPNLDYKTDYCLGAGEIVLLRPNNMQQLREPNKRKQVCSFLWVYFGYPVSDYENINVDSVRYKCGLTMGNNDDSEVDFVSGIPDSGIGLGLSYAEGKGVPYRRAIVKYTPTWPRSFTPSDPGIRKLVAKMKLIPNRSLLTGKRVIFCDDSIVRGTQLSDNVSELYKYGAKEVHIRIGCPPLIYTCPFLHFTATKSDLELITRRIIQEIEGAHDKNLSEYSKTDSVKYRQLVEHIRARFDITSLKFNSLENLVKAIGLPKESLCTHCFDGSSYFD